MTWFTLAQVIELGEDSDVWRARAASGVVSSYVDSRGDLRMWIEEEDLGSSTDVPDLAVSFEPPVEQISEFRWRITRQDASSGANHTDLLTRVAMNWFGSERELERQAGLPKAFLAKAKKGRRGGPRSAASWERLETFLDTLAA